MLQPVRDEGGLRLDLVHTGTVEMTMTAEDLGVPGVAIRCEQTLTRSAPKGIKLASAVASLNLTPADFRPSSGNQVVGNAYTLGEVSPKPEGELQPQVPDVIMAEIALREGPLRIRCRFTYVKEESPAVLSAEGFSLSFASLLVIRESIRGTPAMDLLPLLSSTPGSGIYDPPAAGSDYCQIDLASKVSLLFPRGLRKFPEGSKRRMALSLLWEGNSLRYQADRIFFNLDGSLNSFELTEIMPNDADKYKIAESR